MRLTLEDSKYVNRIVHHPKIYPFITDDYAVFVDRKSGRLGEYFLRNDMYFVLSPTKGAIFIFTPRNLTTYEVHTLVMEKQRGPIAIQAAKDALSWMFTETTCEKVISWVPRPNRRAKPFALMVGLSVDCLLTNSIKLKGELVDQWQVSIEKENFSCQ